MIPRLPNRFRLATVFAILGAASLIGCLAGGGTDVGNPEVARVTGSLRHRDGSPAADFAMHLRPSAYWGSPDRPAPAPAAKGPIQDGHTDSQGFFAFDSVPSGDYRIEGADSVGQGALIGLRVDMKSALVVLSPAYLDAAGSIAGTIRYLRPIVGVYPKITIAAYGTAQATFATSDGSFILSDLPPGRYRLHISTAGDSLSTDGPDTTVSAGVRTTLGPIDLGP